MKNGQEKNNSESKTAGSFKELSEAKTIKDVPADVKGIFAEFSTLPTIASFSLTCRENDKALTRIRLNRKNQLEKQWYGLLAESPEFKQYQKVSIEDFLRLLTRRDEMRVRFWQYVISRNAFMLIDYLIQKKISLNPCIQYRKEEKALLYMGGRSVPYDTSAHTVLDKEFKASPLNTEMLCYLIHLGAKVSEFHFKGSIIPGVVQILNSAEEYSDSRLAAAGKLLRMALERGILDKNYVMREAKHVKHPVIKQIEAAFLIQQLEGILPYSWNFIADQRDAPLIRKTIAQLRQIVALPQMDERNISRLEWLKDVLKSYAVPGGALCRCLQSLQKQGLIALQEDAQSSSLDLVVK